jgi:hypothetical protein
MIIFDLDGTLADCEHRRHFVDPRKNPDVLPIYAKPFDYVNIKDGKIWKPDYEAFNRACFCDTPIDATSQIYDDLGVYHEIQIWSGRCESVRDRTVTWLYENIPYGGEILRMRPIGDSTPDEQLKEKWLDELLDQRKKVEFVFDDRPKVIEMWRRRGIFVFNCAQNDQRF